MFAVMYGKMIFSMILAMDESSETDLYEVPRPGSLFGLGRFLLVSRFEG